MSRDPRDELFDLLEDAAHAGGVFPGCVAAVWRRGSLVYHEAHGVLATHPTSPVRGVPVSRGTIYDLASLSKVLCTTSLFAVEVAAGRIHLDERVPARYAVPWRTAGQEPPPLASLLEHASGLSAHSEYFTTVEAGGTAEAREGVVDAVLRTPLASPPGARAEYSDLGFILLGALLEERLGTRLDRAFARAIARPLQVEDELHFRPREDHVPTRALEHAIAPTEVYDPSLHAGPLPTWFGIGRGVAAHGEVHDDNAWVMGGVAGHAGLFGTALAVLEVGRAWLQGTLPGLDGATRAHLWRPSTVPGSTRRLGFDGPDPSGAGATGSALSPVAVGHLGYTGTSLWIDPKVEAVFVLLSNRVHPTRANEAIRSFRPRFHALAARL